MALEPKNTANQVTFQEKVSALKDYIWDLLRRKKKKIEEIEDETKDEVEEIIEEPEKRSIFDKISDLFSSGDQQLNT